MPSSYTQHVSALKCQLLLLACKFYDLRFYFFWKKQNTVLRSEVQDLLPLDSLFCMDQATTELISLSQRSLSPSHSRGISGGSRPIPGPGGPSYWLLPADVGCGRCPSVPQTASCSADGEGSGEAGPPCILLFCAWAVGSPVKETLAGDIRGHGRGSTHLKNL